MIVHPDTYERFAAYDGARLLARALCRFNRLEEPGYSIVRLRGYGVYLSRTRVIQVDVPRTPKPVRVPGYRWSFTGYKADMTAPGVLLHELGHHLCFVRQRSLYAEWIEFTTSITREKPVTKYGATRIGEDFAEAFRVFALNPDLLRVGWPERYAFMRRHLVPVIEADWRTILQHAHPRFHAAIERRM